MRKELVLPFVLIFLLLAFMSYKIITPLLTPLLWSIILTVFVYPLYLFSLRLFGNSRKTLSSIICTVIVVTVLVFPAIMLLVYIAKEATSFYRFAYLFVKETIPNMSVELYKIIPQEYLPYIKEWINFSELKLSDIIMKTGQFMSSYLLSLSQTAIANTLSLIVDVAVIAMSLFFFLRDGEGILKYAIDVTPLSKSERRVIRRRMKEVLGGIFYGVILTASIQGFLGGIGFAIAGLPSPITFGVMMAFFAMIPFVGTPVIWIPGTLYLFFMNDYGHALFLFFWGIGFVTQIDNVIRPIFISGIGKTPFLLIFIGILGGLFNFGFIGLFLGPLVLALLLFMLESYRRWLVKLKRARKLMLSIAKHKAEQTA